MLDNLRNFASTWPGKILGALLLVGLAGFGISGVITGIGGNTVARVGDREITTLDFQRAYQTQLNVAARQTGSIPTPEQAVSMGIPTIVLTRLATDEAMNILGAEFELGVSDERLGASLRDDPAFAGILGNFDRSGFEQALRQNGYTESEFFQVRRETSYRQQLALGIFGHIRTPDAMKELMTRYGDDQRQVDFFTLSELNLLPIEAPDDEVLAAYLTEQQLNYRTSETRAVNVLVLTPQILAEREEISEADLLAEYEIARPSLTRIERRTLSQVLLPAAATVSWFEFGLENGRDFAGLVESTGLTPSPIGTLTRAEITDNALAEAAFAANEGDYVLVDGVQGQRAVFVSAIEPGGTMTLEEARTQLTDKLKLARGRLLYVDILDQIEEMRAAFVEMDAIASQFDLEISEIELSASGSELGAIDTLVAEDFLRVAFTVFSAQVDRLAPSIALGANKNVWFDLLNIEPARDQTIEEVREALNQAWLSSQRAEALDAQAGALVARIQSGEAFADVAIANALFPQLSQAFGRSGDGTGVIDFSVARAAHEGGVGHIGSARNVNGNFVVFEVTSVTPGDAPVSDDDDAFITGAFRDNIYAEFVSGLRDDANLRVNQQILAQVIGLDVSN